MFLWLMRNHYKLNEFMDIKFSPFSKIHQWKVTYKKPHNTLDEEQKVLSDEFILKLKNSL